jgi:hypothetical protein
MAPALATFTPIAKKVAVCGYPPATSSNQFQLATVSMLISAPAMRWGFFADSPLLA